MARSVQSTVRRVVVTGMGVISPLGSTLHQTWDRLVKGGSGISPLGQEYEHLPCKVAARITDMAEFTAERFSKSDLRTMSPATALALIAAEEALTDAKWKPDSADERESTGVAVGVGMVDLSDVCRTYADLNTRGYNRVSPYFVPRILPNMAAGQISIRFGLKGPNHAVSTACATGAHSIGDAFRFIRHGDAEVMVCGGAESCISPLAIAGFCRLRALSTSFNDATASRPFDKRRDGFVMGEGSAVVVLEELTHALKRKARIHGEILGYGLSGDAAHLTAPSEDGAGAILAMKRALRDAGLQPQDVGFVSAHATSTPLGDVVEARAIGTVFQDHTHKVQVSATKGSHGHLLGAAGNLEAVFTIMACQTGVIPPTINVNEIDPGISLNLVANQSAPWQTLSIGGRRIALKNAFGFGGTNACLCIGHYLPD